MGSVTTWTPSLSIDKLGKQLLGGRLKMLLVLFAICCLCSSLAVQGIPQDGKIKPRALMNIKELINYYGYPCEEYDVVTQDGYILSTYRIPHGREEIANASSKPAIFLLHGMHGEASDWISNSPRNSLGFVLADNGCDVWLGNSRGSPWSRKHVSLSVEDENFWRFSFDHMVQYDLPATIDFILQKTGQQQVFYIGHSQGSTIGFIAFSTMPQLARKIRMNFALAPVVSVKYAVAPLRTFLTLPDFVYKSQVDEYAVRPLGGTSVQNLIHWSQVLKSGKLQAFDYGMLENIVHYGKIDPPEYNITNMNVSTAIWSGGEDVFADPQDVALLLPQITNLTYFKSISEWSHVSFLWDLDAYVQLHSEILNMIKEHY